MKRHWEVDELIEHWTLLPDEEALLENKIGANRLGFAVLFKFFQLEGRFPTSKSDVPKPVTVRSLIFEGQEELMPEYVRFQGDCGDPKTLTV